MNEILIRRLIDLREAAGLSQSEAARRVGIDNSSLSRIESGDRKVSAQELSKLAEVYGVTTDYLLGKNNTPKWATEKDSLDLKEVLDGTVQPSFNFGGEDISDDDRAKLNLAITQIFWEKLEKQRKRAERDGK